MAAKKTTKKTKKPTKREQELRARDLILEEGRIFRATILSTLTRMAAALERTANTHEAILEIAHANHDTAEHTAAYTRAAYDIIAERDGFVIEEGIDGVPLALDMADSELRDYFRRGLQMRRVFKQVEAADAAGVQVDEKAGES
jgi:hypothetical protein